MSAPPASPPITGRFIRSVLLRTALLLLALNLAFAWLDPLPLLGRLSMYNAVFPGRLRLPYGENPARDYNLSPYSLEAMIASHEIAGAAPTPDELRVLVLGDSSIWGFLLQADQTVAAQLDRAGLVLPDGRRVRAFNLGYPIMSLTKDLLILQRTLPYQPDLVIWLVTLESFPRPKQLYPPLLQHNAASVRSLIEAYNLVLDPLDPRLMDDTFWGRTLIGRRRDLADLLRLQLYGVLWAATGVDQEIPETYTPRMEDLPADITFQGFAPGKLTPEDLAFDVLAAGHRLAGQTPVLIVNEPMFVSRGANSDIRYNFYYPRWTYDDYRAWLAQQCAAQGWQCLDLWQAIPADEFTDSAIHYTPDGARLLAERLGAWIQAWAASGAQD
ncbi:MAG: hypothetical protein AB1449_06975 [Chloroflexota bacterium]